LGNGTSISTGLGSNSRQTLRRGGVEAGGEHLQEERNNERRKRKKGKKEKKESKIEGVFFLHALKKGNNDYRPLRNEGRCGGH